MRETTYDLIGIGIGPFNLSLACLVQPIEGLTSLFLDKACDFDWHPGLMLQEAHLQTPFLSDLVTLADPTSPYSFLNYIKEQGRIYSFYIRENFFLMRSEYNQYCQWAINKLDNLQFNTQVEQINYNDELGCYRIQTRCTQTGQVKIYNAKKLVLGTGTLPYIPPCCETVATQSVHSSQYLRHKRELQAKKSITLVGSGQSAAEIYYDLLQEIDIYHYELSWITRSPRFVPLEYNKLTLEMTSPEYVDYFHQLPPTKRDDLIATQKNLYKAINGALINDIYDLLYTKRLTYDLQVNLLTNSELIAAEHSSVDLPGFKNLEGLSATGHFRLEFFQTEQEVQYQHQTEALILATGYSYQLPGFIAGIATKIQWDKLGRFVVNRNYSIDQQGSDIFIQNVEFHTHGFASSDLGMVCYHNSHIINAITGREYYPIEQRIAFQDFAVPAEKVKKTATSELTA
jgi:lysine N6-hydroxylase